MADLTGSDFLRPSITEDSGYSTRDDPAEVVLDANESPYDLPDEVKQNIFERLDGVPYNRYPDSYSRELRALMAEYLGVDTDRLVAGNGSDELIGYLLTACVRPDDRIVIPTPTFSMYELLGRQYYGRVEQVPLDDDWQLTEEFLRRAKEARITFLSYPNNPTGNCFSRKMIEQLLATGSGLVVVDEAYAEFSGKSLLELGDEYPSLIVLRTLSKAFGLAAGRVGFLYGPEVIIRGINTVRLPYNLNTFSQVTAEETLKKRRTVLETVDRIRSEKNRLVEFLEDRGLRPSPTEANFVLFKPDKPQQLDEALLESGVRIRSFPDGPLEGHLRVTVGSPDENERFMNGVDSFQ